MPTSSIMRIIDSNLNRLAEGLRVLEDVARMVLDDTGMTEQLKTLRHDLVRGDLSFNLALLQSRDSVKDVGITLEVAGESREKELPLIVIANARRCQEALRVLEDLSKMPDLSSRLDSNKFKAARFELYTLERNLVSQIMRQDKVERVNGLYVILDTRVLNGRDYLKAAEEVIQAGVKVIQLRDKMLEKAQLLTVARELQSLCRGNNVLFIMNDYLDIALAIEADGLHIGQEDLPVAEARRLLPLDAILGCSAATVEQAQAAESAGADYIAVGSIYPTASKDNIDVVGITRLKQIRAAIKRPLVAIGGINLNNAREAAAAGADSICVISAVLNAPDMMRAAREIIEKIEAKP